MSLNTKMSPLMNDYCREFSKDNPKVTLTTGTNPRFTRSNQMEFEKLLALGAMVAFEYQSVLSKNGRGSEEAVRIMDLYKKKWDNV